MLPGALSHLWEAWGDLRARAANRGPLWSWLAWRQPYSPSGEPPAWPTQGTAQPSSPWQTPGRSPWLFSHFPPHVRLIPCLHLSNLPTSSYPTTLTQFRKQALKQVQTYSHHPPGSIPICFSCCKTAHSPSSDYSLWADPQDKVQSS